MEPGALNLTIVVLLCIVVWEEVVESVVLQALVDLSDDALAELSDENQSTLLVLWSQALLMVEQTVQNTACNRVSH